MDALQVADMVKSHKQFKQEEKEMVALEASSALKASKEPRATKGNSKRPLEEDAPPPSEKKKAKAEKDNRMDAAKAIAMAKALYKPTTGAREVPQSEKDAQQKAADAKRIKQLEKEVQNAQLTVPKLRLESLEERLEAANTENAALKAKLRAAEVALSRRAGDEEKAEKGKDIVKAAQESYGKKVEEVLQGQPASADAGSKKPSRELLRLASFGTNKGSRRLAKELVYPCEFKHIKGLFLFQSLLLTDPGLLEANCHAIPCRA